MPKRKRDLVVQLPPRPPITDAVAEQLSRAEEKFASLSAEVARLTEIASDRIPSPLLRSVHHAQERFLRQLARAKAAHNASNC